jgi:hypothetical protein
VDLARQDRDQDRDQGGAAPGGPATRSGGTAVSRRSGGTAVSRRFEAAVLVAVNLPIVVAAWRGLARGFQPLGDNGMLLVRARDVATAHHPLLGSWSSSSAVLDQNLNNPGPLYPDALALPIKVLGPWVGLAVGVMLVNMAASTIAVVLAGRIGGTSTLVAVALGVVAVQWIMGSELLYDIWQPNALMLPMMAFLVAVACLATGDLAVAPWVVGIGSLLVQTHLSNLPVVALLVVASAAFGGWTVRRTGERPEWRRPLRWTAVVAVLAWFQPVVEQVSSAGRGNMARIASAGTGGSGEAIGLSRAVRLVAEAVVVEPWFTRASFVDAVPPGVQGHDMAGLVSFGRGLLVLAVLVLGLAVLAGVCWRSGRRSLATMVGTSALALVGGVAAVAVSPLNVVGTTPHQMRWLWPIAAFASAAVLAAALDALRSWPRPARWALTGVAATALAVSAATLPTHVSDGLFTSPTVDAEAYLPAARELVGDLDELAGRGTVLYDPTGIPFADPYSGLVWAELQDQDVPFVFDDEVLIRHFGEGRRAGRTAELRLWEAFGPEALDPPPGAERVGFTEGPTGPVALFVEPIDR